MLREIVALVSTSIINEEPIDLDILAKNAFWVRLRSLEVARVQPRVYNLINITKHQYLVSRFNMKITWLIFAVLNVSEIQVNYFLGTCVKSVKFIVKGQI
jgi:hypothetical protein